MQLLISFLLPKPKKAICRYTQTITCVIGSTSDGSGYVLLSYLSLWLVETSEVSHVDDAHKCWAARTAEIGLHTTSEVICSISFLFLIRCGNKGRAALLYSHLRVAQNRADKKSTPQ